MMARGGICGGKARGATSHVYGGRTEPQQAFSPQFQTPKSGCLICCENYMGLAQK
jgi:hypothetical protein